MLSSLPNALHQCLHEPLNGSNLRTLFLLLTRAHYSATKNYGYLEPQLSCVLYTGEEQGLTVELSQAYDYNKTVKRPAVYVGVDQPLAFKKIDIHHSQKTLPDNSGEDHGFIVNTAVSFIHVADSIDTALIMADSTTSFFIGLRSHLMDKLKFMAFEPVSISPPAQISTAPEKYFRVDAQFNLSYNFVVQANLESHRLKKLAFEISSEV